MRAKPHSTSFKAIHARKERAQEFDRALEAIGSSIRDPVLKLQFLRESLAQYETLRQRVDWIPFATIRRAAYRWLSLERFRSYADSRAVAPRARARLRRSLFLVRLSAGMALMIAIMGVAALSIGILVTIPAISARVAAPHLNKDSRHAGSSRPDSATRPTAAIAPLPTVWLVEHGQGWEQYSNGLRIETTYSVVGERRRFRALDDQGILGEIYHSPVGILYHTSESDIWPLEASFNERLRDSSHQLLRYIRRLKLYNYVIDRFGRAFRVVEDDCKANHSGFSIWGHNQRYYLNLNHPFLGICFESRWDGGVSLPITTAQITTARSLTECLRYRFGIAAEMCAGHGMTSVNPTRHLIGHHLDWARGLPFSDLGLPDQYLRPPPSIAVFGFVYDDHFLTEMGQPWSGVQVAERLLAAEANRRGTSLEIMRAEKQSRYDVWLSELTRDEEQSSLPTKRVANDDPPGE